GRPEDALRSGEPTSGCDFFRGPLRAASAAAAGGEAVEVGADVRRLGRGVGERDRPVEGDARLLGAAELLEQSALQAEEVEIARKALGERLDHGERRL